MKSQHDIQRAHDLLAGVILGDAPSPFGKPQSGEFAKLLAALDASDHKAADIIRFQLMQETASVLCWVLEHEHSTTFGQSLRNLERWLLEQGLELVDHSN
jgi:hypothetical protein